MAGRKDVSHLHQYANVQCDLIVWLYTSLLFPMHVPKEVSALIVHHDAFVECMELDEAILPALLLSSNVVGV